MRAIGFLAGLVVGVMFLDQTCPDCGPQDCGPATAPLPRANPKRQIHEPPPEPKPLKRAKRAPRVKPRPEPCPSGGLLCQLIGPFANQAVSKPEAKLDSFFEDVSTDN